MISFALTTHNEGQCIDTLLNQLVFHCMQTRDEIVILDDFSDDETTTGVLKAWENHDRITLHQRKFAGDFAEHKNHLNSLCTKEYIFQIDADELLSDGLSSRLHKLLELNEVDLIYVPRVNTVEGLTDEDIANFGWTVDENGWVMWPDFQGRIYRNHKDIQWHGKVHERIVGVMKWSFLPREEDWAILHVKDIERQREQNAFYSTIA